MLLMTFIDATVREHFIIIFLKMGNLNPALNPLFYSLSSTNELAFRTLHNFDIVFAGYSIPSNS